MDDYKYNKDTQEGSDNIPDFLIDSVPYLNNTRHINSQLSKDKINPYLPAEKARKLSSSSVKSIESLNNNVERSFNSEGDASKFSFEPLSGGPSPINKNSGGQRILSTSSEPVTVHQHNNSNQRQVHQQAQRPLHSNNPNASSQNSSHAHVRADVPTNNNSFNTTFNSSGFITANNSAATDMTPSKVALPPSSKSASPKVPLTIQTSTPNERDPIRNQSFDYAQHSSSGFYDSTNDSNNQFSFFNTSPAYHPESPSSNIKTTLNKRASIIPRESPHSRNSSISWAVNNPDEWTIERVVYWLELHQFNETWASVFIKHNIFGQSFLSMTNYQNLKNYKQELSTANDSTQSRFIHLLRKTLDKPSSGTTTISAAAFSPFPVSNSPAASFDSLESSPANSDDIILRDDNAIEQRDNEEDSSLAPTISAPQLVIPNNEKPASSPPSNAATLNQAPPPPLHPQQRLTRVNSKRRPVSTYEHSSKNMWANSPISPAVSNHSLHHNNHGFFRRHQKSSSSESSLFSSIFPSGVQANSQQQQTHTQGQPQLTQNQSYQDKRCSVASKIENNESKGLLSKFRLRNDRSKSREPNRRDSQSPVSPVSMSALDAGANGNHQSRPSAQKSYVSEKKLDTRLNEDLTKPLTIDRKYLPSPNSRNSDKYVLVTKDNETFQPVNIGHTATLASLKTSLINSVFPNIVDASIHLTDFGCSMGEALDDSTLDTLFRTSLANFPAKFLIAPTNNLSASVTTSSSITSFSDSQSFETKLDGDKLYPNTPQHFYNDSSVSKSTEVDYLNFKTLTATQPQPPTIPAANLSATSSSSPPSASSTVPVSSQSPPIIIHAPPPIHPDQKNPIREKRAINIHLPPPAHPDSVNNTGENRRSSFRVIRPKERPEINFDKRRESPFTRQLSSTSFVARRNAPPPPLSRQQSSFSEKPLLTPVKESVSNEGTYIASYTPGSSNTLVPEPYKGGSGSVSPVSRKAFELSQGIATDKSDDSSKSSGVSRATSVVRSRSNAIKRSITRNFSRNSANSADKFQENVISFDDAPTLEDETSDDDSDDGFWAKTPTDLSKDQQEQKEEGDSSGEAFGQEISKMVLRPAPEVLYDNLEKFFPNANLDQPVVDVTPPASPMNDKKAKKEQSANIQKTVISSTSFDEESGMEKLSKPHRVKTIRAVAREASEARKRESIRRRVSNENPLARNKVTNKHTSAVTGSGAAVSNSQLVRRQSTKMWGKKVVEVKPNQTQYLSKLRSSKGEIKQFSWIRGDLIGKGTFGNVFLALNVTTGEMIAVKQVLAPPVITNNNPNGPQNNKVPEVIEALRSEVETLKDLDHLNIVQYLGFEKTDREYNLFLEYVAGGSIASCLRLYGKFEEPLIKFLTAQVLDGLSYLHSQGILHRDMKADNLLLDLDGVCKISDFGISKKSNDIYANDAAMSMQGTIFWMAPEVVDSRAGYSAKVDIWSLGCVVLEMFAGRRPWSNLEAITAMFKIGKSKAAPPIPEDILPEVSMDGRNFLDCCFAIDANKRPTAQELLNNTFCEVETGFTFASTRLAQLIRANEKKINIVH